MNRSSSVFVYRQVSSRGVGRPASKKPVTEPGQNLSVSLGNGRHRKPFRLEKLGFLRLESTDNLSLRFAQIRTQYNRSLLFVLYIQRLARYVDNIYLTSSSA